MATQDSQNKKKFIKTFSDNKELEAQKSECMLSQPPAKLSRRQRLQWIQARRTTGLWVQCDECERWRYLPHLLDRHELPQRWYCRMNPDATAADCSVAESPIQVRDEEDLIYSEYSAGSVVWARLAGWPWWPAMVDDCPDTEQYYWLDGFSDIPTHYNVVFFDSIEVTRAWISPNNLKPYASMKNSLKQLITGRYKNRLEVAVQKACDAISLPLHRRLVKYSFLAGYKGIILDQKKINKKDLIKHQKKMEKKLNVEIPFDDDLDFDIVTVPDDEHRKRKNVVVFGTLKKPKDVNKIDITVSSSINDLELQKIDDGSANNAAKEPDSMAVQIGSTIETTDTTTEFTENDTSATYVPETNINSEMESNFEVRIASPSSDDFDF